MTLLQPRALPANTTRANLSNGRNARVASGRIESDSPRFQLRFKPLVATSSGFAFPCDDKGHVSLDTMSERARNDYFYARAMVGRELTPPAMERSR
jgi:hypothetical protein